MDSSNESEIVRKRRKINYNHSLRKHRASSCAFTKNRGYFLITILVLLSPFPCPMYVIVIRLLRYVLPLPSEIHVHRHKKYTHLYINDAYRTNELYSYCHIIMVIIT